jgi:hypothetical protein
MSSNYDEWQHAYDRGMRGPSYGVDDLLSNYEGQRNGFGGGHEHSEYSIAEEVMADDGMNDLSVSMAPVLQGEGMYGEFGRHEAEVPLAAGYVAVKAA